MWYQQVLCWYLSTSNSWTNPSPTDSSWLQVSYDKSFKKPAIDLVLSDSAYRHLNIQQDTIHYWRVRQKNAIGWGPWSVTGNFIRQDATVIGSSAFDHLVKVYPNPFKRELIIESWTKNYVSEVEVYNMPGEKVVVRADNGDGRRIFMNVDYSGLLILRIKLDDGKVIVKKLVSH